MSRVLIVLGVCVLLMAMPAYMAVPMHEAKRLKTTFVSTAESCFSAVNDTPPDWANGNFSGVWGLNLLGRPLPPAGWVAGYYSNMGVGRFVGVFAEFNATNVTGYLGGLFFGPFMVGIVGNITTGNSTYFVGPGRHNETHFYWRLMGIVGPTYYMYGKYSRFED